MSLKINKPLSLSLASGILLSLPWLGYCSGMVLLFAFVPLFFMEVYFIKNHSKAAIFYAMLSVFIWNFLTTWWIAKASVAGAIAAIGINTCLLSLVFGLYWATKRKMGGLVGGISLVVYWTAYEYLYLNAEISWPWLNLGNGLANDFRFIQWYEYTGTLGGTVWILSANVFIFAFLKGFHSSMGTLKRVVLLIVCIVFVFAPVLFSFVKFKYYKESFAPCKVAIIQPNADSYNNIVSPLSKCGVLVECMDSLKDRGIDYFIAPENAISDNILENSILANRSISLLRAAVKNTNAHLVFGAITFRNYKKGEPVTATAQYEKFGDCFFDMYNSAIEIDSSPVVPIYHKSKLVVGIEKVPYPKFFKFMEKPLAGFGAGYVSYGTQNYRGVFLGGTGKFAAAPIICYESVYGEFVTGYVKNGANLFFIITNDGWWGDTPGYRQHLSYARIRAIENRRSIARSANTGISAVINQRGEVMESIPWGKRGVILSSLNMNNKMTFYSRHGDYLGVLACIVSACIGFILLIRFLKGIRF